MKLSNFVDGLQTLRTYYNDPDGWHIGAEHDQFYAYKTDMPLSDNDFSKMRKLGWFQPEVDADKYDADEGWSAYT